MRARGLLEGEVGAGLLVLEGFVLFLTDARGERHGDEEGEEEGFVVHVAG